MKKVDCDLELMYLEEFSLFVGCLVVIVVWLCISALLYILYNLIVLWVDRKGWLDQWYVFNTIIDSNQKVKKPIVILGTYGMLLSDMVEMDNYIVNKRISTLYIPSFLYIKKRCYI